MRRCQRKTERQRPLGSAFPVEGWDFSVTGVRRLLVQEQGEPRQTHEGVHRQRGARDTIDVSAKASLVGQSGMLELIGKRANLLYKVPL